MGDDASTALGSSLYKLSSLKSAPCRVCSHEKEFVLRSGRIVPCLGGWFLSQWVPREVDSIHFSHMSLAREWGHERNALLGAHSRGSH